MDHTIGLIAIDGPTASGKGTIAQIVAKELGFHYLDSGALYRIVGLASKEQGIPFEKPSELAKMVEGLEIRFDGERIFVRNQDISNDIRTEEMGQRASMSGAIAQVRAALFTLQRSFLRPPGLVADGRDMATVIFPEAELKVFLTASSEVRTERRYKQLIAKGIPAKIDVLTQDLIERDLRDTQRKDAPLVQAKDAKLLDTSHMGIEEAVQQILNWYKSIRTK